MNEALGVGNSGDKDPVAAVRGAKGRSRKAVPLRVVPERGQPPEYLSEDLSVVEREEVCNVLHDDVAGSKVANDSVHLSPKRRLGMAEAGAKTSGADALAGEAAGDDVDSGSVRANCSDVGVDGDAEALVEEALSELVDLAEPSVLEPGEVESIGQEAAAVEESADKERHKPFR